MNWLGYKRVSFGKLRITEEIKARTKEARVAELASSFREATANEPGNCPWVRRGGRSYEIVAGRDRVAALLVLKAKTLWVRAGEFTDREVLLAEVHENAHRRNDDRAALLTRLVEETVAEHRNGPLRSAVASARKQVSDETGVSTAALKQMAHRERAKKVRESSNGAAAPQDEAVAPSVEAAGTPVAAVSGQGEAAVIPLAGGSLASPVTTELADDPYGKPVHAFGLVMPEVLAAFLADRAKHLRVAAQAASRVMAALSGLLAASIELERLYGEQRRLAADIRAQVPDTICFWCKAIDAADCFPCGGRGWLTAGQVASMDKAIPKELLAEGVAAMVTRAGRFVLATSLGATVDAGVATTVVPSLPGGRRVRVVVECRGCSGEREADMPCVTCGFDETTEVHEESWT